MPMIFVADKKPQDILKKIKSLTEEDPKTRKLPIEVAFPDDLNEFKPEDIKAFFNALPQNIMTLEVSSQALRLPDKSALKECLSAIPSSIKTIDLSFNSLLEITQLPEALAVLSDQITTLDLSANAFAPPQGLNFQALAQAFPRGLHKLVMSQNRLSEINQQELLSWASDLPRGLKDLDISQNALGMLNQETLVGFVQHFPALTHLDLSQNLLGEAQGLNLPNVLKALPNTVRCLDLSGNFFNNMATDDIIAMLQSLPPHVKHVDLGRNNLILKKLSDAQRVMASLPSSVESVVLGANGFDLNKEEYVLILQSLPSSVQQVKCGTDDGSPQQIIASQRSQTAMSRSTGLIFILNQIAAAIAALLRFLSRLIVIQRGRSTPVASKKQTPFSEVVSTQQTETESLPEQVLSVNDDQSPIETQDRERAYDHRGQKEGRVYPQDDTHSKINILLQTQPPQRYSQNHHRVPLTVTRRRSQKRSEREF